MEHRGSTKSFMCLRCGLAEVGWGRFANLEAAWARAVELAEQDWEQARL